MVWKEENVLLPSQVYNKTVEVGNNNNVFDNSERIVQIVVHEAVDCVVTICIDF